MSATDLAYYEKEDDYEEIKMYLDMDSVEENLGEQDLPSFEPDFSSSIIIDNVPKVPKDKMSRLLDVLLKIYVQLSAIQQKDIHMPFDESTGLTHGFCFVKFATKDEAEQAMKVTQGLAIDKKHTFKISLYSDLDKYASIPNDYTPPPPKAIHIRPDPTSWLADTQFRDQFVIRHTHDTEVFWCANVAGEDPSMVYGGEREKEDGKVWCESFVTWSPQGTYLATFHPQGIKLWGSSDFESQGRFMHSKVEDLAFSPCENYLITYRYSYPEGIIVWDIRSGEKLRSFDFKNPGDINYFVQFTVKEVKDDGKEGKERIVRGRVKAYDEETDTYKIEEGNKEHLDVPAMFFNGKEEHHNVLPIQEPNRLKWSPDGKYVARLGPDIISVYQLPSMTLLDKKSIACREILDFVWSPRKSMISYWSPSVGNHPALINIISIPERETMSSRKLFDVTDGRMVWQNEGDYLCVHMTKQQGRKRSYVLMFFRTSDPNVPVEQIELTEPILNVSWEPSGDKICIMYGETRSPNIAFYSMSCKLGAGKTRNEVTHLFTRSGQNCSEVLWSPAGGMAALAYFAHDTCIFDLLDIENNISMAARRHDRCNKLYWDPSGRYIASCTITDLRNVGTKGHMDDGYNIFTFQGALVASVKREKLYQFAWRPRPKGLLSAEEKKKVIKNLRKYEKIFEKEDRQRKVEIEKAQIEARFKTADEFFIRYNQLKQVARASRSKKIADRGGYDSEDEANFKIERVINEQVLSTKDIVMQ